MQIKDNTYDNNPRFSPDALSQRRGLLDPVFATVMVAFFLPSAWVIIADARADLRQTKRVV